MPSKMHDDPQLTLVFLGGSTTECLYVDEENRFPYVVGRLLEKKTGLKVNSYNSGRAGNDSLHSLDILLNKVIPLKPNIVVMMHNVNDLSILLVEGTYWNKNPSRRPIMEKKPAAKTVFKNFEENFHLIRDLTIPLLAREIKHVFRRFRKGDEFRHKRGQKIIINQAFMLEEFRMNLQTFINICRARNLTPVLMTQASRLKTPPEPLISSLMKKIEEKHGTTYQEYKDIFDLFNQTIREVGAQSQVSVIDLAKQLPPEREYLHDVVHLNNRGCQYTAGIIAEGLTPLLKSRLLSPN
jgi:lysophospholipase L1-like esterase